MNTLQFKSLDGTLMTVSLGDGDMQLVGAVSPVVISEDTNEDIFAPVRCKTGVVRLHVDDVQTLQSLMPTKAGDPTKRVVISYPDNTIAFRGFIQATAFSQSFVGHSHEVEIPVSGLLDAMKSIDFPYAQFLHNSPYIPLSTLIVTAFKAADSSFSLSDIHAEADMVNAMTTLFNVYNIIEEKGEEDVYDGNLFEPMSCYDVIESVCKYFGVCCREVGNSITFHYLDKPAISYDLKPESLSGNSDQQSFIAGKKSVKVESKVNKFSENAFTLDFNTLKHDGNKTSSYKNYDGKYHVFVSNFYGNPEGKQTFHNVVPKSLFVEQYVDETYTMVTPKASIEDIVHITQGSVGIANPTNIEESVAMVMPLTIGSEGSVIVGIQSDRIITTPLGSRNFLAINIDGSFMIDYHTEETSDDFMVEFPFCIKVGSKYLTYTYSNLNGGEYIPSWSDEKQLVRLRYEKSIQEIGFLSMTMTGWTNPMYQYIKQFELPLKAAQHYYGLPKNCALFPLPEDTSTGTVYIEFVKPIIHATNAQFMFLRSLNINIVKQYTFEEKLNKTAEKDRNTYSYNLDAGRDEYAIQSDWSTAVGLERGYGIVLNADGSNYHNYKNGKCPEECTLARMAEYYNRNHSVLTISMDLDQTIDLVSDFIIPNIIGKDYVIAAVETDYYNNIQTLTLIEL